MTAALTLAACSTPATAGGVDRQPPETLPDGVVRVPEASRQFLAVETAGTSGDGSTLRAPARVDFKDGALAHVGAPLEGRVVRVHVQTGDAVHRGDPLVTLDCPDAAAQRAAVATATASLVEARAALVRDRRMLEEGVGIEREKLEAETRVASLEAELSRAQAGVAFVGDGSGTAVVVRAPLAGTVISRKATEGMTVQAGEEHLIDIGDPSALWVVADVFERDVQQVHDGAVARIEFPSLQQPLEGRVAAIGTVVSTGVRTAAVRIALPAHSTQLRPGMSGRAEIAVAGATGLTLPSEAVLIKGTETIVYIEKDSTTFERRTIVVAPPVNGRVPVLSGLAPGDRVVVRGALLLDGAADQLL